MRSLLAIVLSVLSCALPPAAAQPPTRIEAAAARQVLVMLRLPPQHYHPDAAYAGRYPNDSGRAARRRTAQELAQSHGLKLVDDWPMPVIGVDCFVMEQTGDAPLERTVQDLARDPRVMWAQAMHTFRGLDAGDPLYPVQPAAKYWRLAELHKASTGRNVRVAVVDSGIDGLHPDLTGQVQLRENFVDGSPDGAEAHGTAVAGIIAARAGNGIGIAGVAPDARLLALRACWPDSAGTTRCNSFTLGKAINFAIMNGAHIVNLSLTGPPDQLLGTLLDAAAARGMAVVGAADPDRADGGFPAMWPGVIAVSATAGPLRAPGADIPTTAPGGRWGFVTGASYAAAHVSGLAALITQLQPGTPAQLRNKIVTTHTATVSTGSSAQAGNIDACASIARITGACVCSCTSIAAMKVSTP